MIARHSAEESKGGGDGVEVVVNEPCHDEQHGDGRYTQKRIYLTRYCRLTSEYRHSAGRPLVHHRHVRRYVWSVMQCTK